ncbi:MAG: alpha/beta fold hydrolase [Solirubrobacteraceae bacterium]
MPAAVTVVMVSGFMQPASAWEPVANLLPERYPSVLLDHREHDYEGRLVEIAGAGEGAVLMGYSLGGRLLLHAAVRDPRRYRALVTVGSSAGLDVPAERAARREADDRLAAWIESTPIEDVVGAWERLPLFADQADALVADQRPGRLAQSPADLATLLRTAGQGALRPIWRLLPRLERPVLALSGEHDERYRTAAARIADLAPDAHARTVEDAGHAAHLQQAEAVAALAVQFLDENLG